MELAVFSKYMLTLESLCILVVLGGVLLIRTLPTKSITGKNNTSWQDQTKTYITKGTKGWDTHPPPNPFSNYQLPLFHCNTLHRRRFLAPGLLRQVFCDIKSNSLLTTKCHSWTQWRDPLLTLRGKPLYSLQWFYSRTPIFTHVASARRRYLPRGMVIA